MTKGFAPFFDRARQSVGQALRGAGDDLEARLSSVVVTVAFDENAQASGEARHALDMAVRLAARLYPRIRILPLHGDDRLADELVTLARSINPNLVVEDRLESAKEIALVVGSTGHAADVSVHVGSDGWIAKVSTSAPVGSGAGDNPFGAGAAACIGMANVFRAVFADRLRGRSLDSDVAFSLLDFETGPRAGNAATAPVDLGDVRLVGVGAVGNAFVWAVARLPGLRGTLRPIDHETVESSNLQRYVLATMADEDAVKVDLAKRALAGTKIKVAPSRATWSEHVQRSAGARFDLVAVALDSARDRVMVQSSLPRRIVNAWTQDGDLGVSRHGFEGDEACMACLYLPKGRRRSLDEIVADELKLDHETHKMRLRDLLYRDLPVGEAFAREVAAAAGVDAETLIPHADLPLRSFRQRAVCGGLVMRASDGGGSEVEVPLAFQSALAGLMLAAEVVAERSGLRASRPPTRTIVDLLRPIGTNLNSNVLKGTSAAARCICQDVDWQDAYRDRWAAEGRPSRGPSASSGEPPSSKRSRRRSRKAG